MRISEDGVKFIKKFEGLSLKAYRDSKGVWTIGYGSTRDVKPGMVITKEEAESRLRMDLTSREFVVNRLVRVPLTQAQFDALVSFEYNTGGLNGSNLLRKLNAKDYKGAANQFLRWRYIRISKTQWRELPGLVRRRYAEKRLFLEGKYE